MNGLLVVIVGVVVKCHYPRRGRPSEVRVYLCVEACPDDPADLRSWEPSSFREDAKDHKSHPAEPQHPKAIDPEDLRVLAGRTPPRHATARMHRVRL